MSKYTHLREDTGVKEYGCVGEMWPRDPHTGRSQPELRWLYPPPPKAEPQTEPGTRWEARGAGLPAGALSTRVACLARVERERSWVPPSRAQVPARRCLPKGTMMGQVIL